MQMVNIGLELREMLLTQRTGSGLMARLLQFRSGIFLVETTIAQDLMGQKDGFGRTPAAS
jgi:hypothetical protein